MGVRHDDRTAQPHPCRDGVRLGQKRTNRPWDDVGEHEFQGVCVFGGQRNWCLKLVMLLVDLLVPLRPVQRPVQGVEDDLEDAKVEVWRPS